MTLTASSTDLFPTMFSTLTATANADVGPTPYYIRIYDLSSNSYIATCGSGTTCSFGVTEPTPNSQEYVALISDASGSYPPGNIRATSSPAFILWHSTGVSLTASATTLGVGGISTLTATSSADVGPSPFYIEIFDATTGVLVADCGFGTTCTASVSQSDAETDQYVAYISQFSASSPPPGIQATSDTSFVTWTSSGWQVSLSGPEENFGSGTYTATVNGDVGPTPWWIEIWDETTGRLLTECGSGGSCAVAYTPSSRGETLVAFVASAGSAYPPAGIQASSNVLFTYFQIIP